MAERIVLALISSVFIFCSATCLSGNENLDADVLILGAGMTGVAAAKTLFDAGVRNFLILEARDEIGGRMRSMDFAGVTVELGANWIQGVDRTGKKYKTNPIWALKQRCGLEGVFTNLTWRPGPLLVYAKNGDNITTSRSMRYSDVHKAFEDVQKYSNSQRASGKPDESLRVALTRVGWTPLTSSDDFLDWLTFDFDQADSPENLSLFTSINDDRTYSDFGKDNFFVTDKRGYSHLVRCLAEDFLIDRQNKLHLNTQIKTIEYDDECVCAMSVSGRKFCGKHGIVTFSIGVLQGNDVTFLPELPKAKTDAIKLIRNGLFLKIFLQFSKTFWSNDSDVVFIGRTSKRGNYPLFLPSGKYYPSKPNVLVAIITGQTAVRVAEQDLDITKQQILAALRTMYPNFNAELLDIYVPDWELNPLYRGSFSSFLVGLTEEKLDTIAAPIGRLYISGEGVSKNYNGYVHGAYFTGVDTAKAIIKNT